MTKDHDHHSHSSVDELRLRPTRLNGDPPAPDDFEVFWRDTPVGRLLKQPGAPAGKPNWFWRVILPNKPQPAYHRGICSNIEECKRRFKVASSGVRATLLADLERRSRWPGSKYPARS
jgi:hypothetical protein